MEIINKIKKSFLYVEEKIPFLGKFLISFLRFLRFHLYYRPILFFVKLKRDDKDLFKIYWVSPDKIKYQCVFKRKINKIKDRGRIMGGDWDLSNKKFEDNFIYKGAKERFIDGKEWKETIVYKKAIEQISQGKIWNGCNNEERLKKYFEGFDTLYNNIKQNGYIPHAKIKNFKTKINKADPYTKNIDEIKVGIGRNGQILFIDGRHRLAIARILGIKKVAVRVFVRHKQWADFKNKLLFYAKKQGGEIYQKAYHFDLESVPCAYGNERFDLIRDNLSLKQGSVLDIGANFGYFCHKLEKLGFDCTAVEINPQEVYFMEKLKIANEDNFKIIQENIFDFRRTEKLNHDLILALYIFHHS